MMNCNNCGALNSGEMPFCSKCGSSWGWECSCKNINPIEAKFCAMCGSPRMDTVKPDSKPSPANKIAPAAIPAGSKDDKQKAATRIAGAQVAARPAVIVQLSDKQIEILIAESSSMSLADKETITQDDIDRLFEGTH